MAITKVVLPNGKTDTDAGWGKPQRERVIPDWVASTVTQVLEQNMLAGTGTGAHVYGHTDAGKTGTTDDYADAWFCGYTPHLEATVWMGYPQGEVPMLDVHGIAVTGGSLPASVWHAFMTTAIGGRGDVAFPAPQTPPVWTSWHGQWQYSGAYGYSSSAGSQPTTTAAATTRPRTPTTRAATTEAPPTTTVQPPPVTTAPAPPPVTTETVATTPASP
jgi:penicillin-binding protein 1A